MAAVPPSPLDAAIGLAFVEYDAFGRAILDLASTTVANGSADATFLHGGALATCVDTAGWYAVVAARAGSWVAVDLRTDFLRIAPPGRYRVIGTCLRAGRTLATADVSVEPWDEPGRMIASGRATFLRTGD